MKIYPVLLSGGAGSRLWPLSRELYPKQLLNLASEKSMIQDTALRVSDDKVFGQPLVICNNEHRFIIAEQLREVNIQPSAIMLEPVARNTAPAVAVAALKLLEDDEDAMMLVLPADHIIENVEIFREKVAVASEVAEKGYLVTFGITPTGPETGYGYIHHDSPLEGVDGAYVVGSFKEKPSLTKAEEYLKDGGYVWNSGMFLFSARRYVEELEALHPDMLAACKQSLEDGQGDLDFFRLDEDAFGQAKNISIDYAVMEQTNRAAVVPADIGWCDVGAFSALWDVGEKDADGNVVQGDAMLHDCKNSYVRGDHRLLAAVGLENMVVVDTHDAVLVADKSKVQNVKALVERMREEGRQEAKSHARVYRPWGFYQSVHEGDRFQVKRITVYPGQKLSLQKHHHRAEHWVVVNGAAMVTRDNEEKMLTENESIYLPIGAIHRLENPGKVDLNLIEVQVGAYLGEDDIVRIEDTYGRA